MIYNLDNRKLIKISMDDAESFLQNILSNDIAQLGVGDLQYSLLLTPQGKILYDFFILKTPNAFYLDCYAKFLKAIVQKLQTYKLHSRIVISMVDATIFITNTILRKNCFIDPRNINLGYRLYDFDNEQKRANLDRSFVSHYNQIRLKYTVPEFGLDFTSDKFFPLDLGMDQLNAVSFNKGCFVGQEVTARMNYRNKRKKYLKCINVDEYKINDGCVVQNGRKLGVILNTYQNKALVLLKNYSPVCVSRSLT